MLEGQDKRTEERNGCKNYGEGTVARCVQSTDTSGQRCPKYLSKTRQKLEIVKHPIHKVEIQIYGTKIAVNFLCFTKHCSAKHPTKRSVEC